MHRAAVALVAILLAAACRPTAPATRPHAERAPWARLAATPPMGWNSWNRFHCDVSETLVRETADAMVATGMRDAGYRYVVIDDCWQASRAPDGAIVPDPARFPSGMRALADYVHARGLAFGLYSDAGSHTCQGRPGGNGYETADARRYADWGVDYLKYDWCHTEGVDPRIAYTTMRDALAATGRPIVLSMCEWGKSRPWTWARGVAHLWRTTDDILPCWDCTTPQGGLAWPRIVDLQAPLARYGGPGGWNDPDMLQVGNEGMTLAESRAHFSLWCVLAAPLMAGNDVRAMSAEVRDLLTDRELVAIDQDPLGRPGRKLRDDGDGEVWARPLADGGWAVVLFNRARAPRRITVSWRALGLPAGAAPAVRDLWAKRDLGRVRGRVAADVASHDVVVLRVSP